MNLRALEALEFERIRELLMERTASAVGRERAAELAPLATPETVTAVLATVAEMLSLIMEVPRWQGAGAPDVRAALEQARVAGGLLESGQLRDVARLVAIAKYNDGFVIHGPDDRFGNHFTGISLMVGTGSVRIERPDDGDRQSVCFVICPGVRFSCQLSCPVHRAGIGGMRFIHGHVLCRAVHFR